MSCVFGKQTIRKQSGAHHYYWQLSAAPEDKQKGKVWCGKAACLPHMQHSQKERGEESLPKRDQTNSGYSHKMILSRIHICNSPSLNSDIIMHLGKKQTRVSIFWCSKELQESLGWLRRLPALRKVKENCKVLKVIFKLCFYILLTGLLSCACCISAYLSLLTEAEHVRRRVWCMYEIMDTLAEYLETKRPMALEKPTRTTFDIGWCIQAFSWCFILSAITRVLWITITVFADNMAKSDQNKSSTSLIWHFCLACTICNCLICGNLSEKTEYDWLISTYDSADYLFELIILSITDFHFHSALCSGQNCRALICRPPQGERLIFFLKCEFEIDLQQYLISSSHFSLAYLWTSLQDLSNDLIQVSRFN